MMLVSINNPLPLSRGILCTYSIKTVSYTHLDVYKRQFQEFPMSLERWLFEKDVDDNTIRDRIQDIVDELADCLLYTSYF